MLPDVVFASEPYGAPLAACLGARFIPVDLGRAAVPISATAIRAAPQACWPMLPPPVRAHYPRRVAVVGPEASGKPPTWSVPAADLGATRRPLEAAAPPSPPRTPGRKAYKQPVQVPPRVGASGLPPPLPSFIVCLCSCRSLELELSHLNQYCHKQGGPAATSTQSCLIRRFHNTPLQTIPASHATTSTATRPS